MSNTLQVKVVTLKSSGDQIRLRSESISHKDGFIIGLSLDNEAVEIANSDISNIVEQRFVRTQAIGDDNRPGALMTCWSPRIQTIQVSGYVPSGPEGFFRPRRREGFHDSVTMHYGEGCYQRIPVIPTLLLVGFCLGAFILRRVSLSMATVFGVSLSLVWGITVAVTEGKLSFVWGGTGIGFGNIFVGALVGALVRLVGVLLASLMK